MIGDVAITRDLVDWLRSATGPTKETRAISARLSVRRWKGAYTFYDVLRTSSVPQPQWIQIAVVTQRTQDARVCVLNETTPEEHAFVVSLLGNTLTTPPDRTTVGAAELGNGTVVEGVLELSQQPEWLVAMGTWREFVLSQVGGGGVGDFVVFEGRRRRVREHRGLPCVTVRGRPVPLAALRGTRYRA
jgi:hypothetical protein